MSEPSRISPSRKSRIRGRFRGRSHYRKSIMFPEPTAPGSDTDIPFHSAQLSNSYTTSPNNAAFSAHVPTLLVMSSRAHPVNLSETEGFSRFDPHSHTLSDTIQERDRLCHDLNETKIKLHNL